MFLKIEDAEGPVCINMDTGLRIRPKKTNNISAGVQVIFPDGNTNITVRGDYEQMCKHLKAVDGVR